MDRPLDHLALVFGASVGGTFELSGRAQFMGLDDGTALEHSYRPVAGMSAAKGSCYHLARDGQSLRFEAILGGCLPVLGLARRTSCSLAYSVFLSKATFLLVWKD